MLKNYFQLMRFDKPIGTLLLLWPTLWALTIAQRGLIYSKITLIFILGVIITRASGCTINDFFDYNFDKNVARTKFRPLANNKINKERALILFIVLCIIAFLMILFNLKNATILMSVPALLLFITYPLMKRIFILPQAYLGIAFSFGILMVFIEVTDNISLIAWILFFANVFWTLSYDTIYALSDIKYDKELGLYSSAITFGKYVNQFIGLFFLFFISLMFVAAKILNYNFIFYIILLLPFCLLLLQLYLLKLEKDSIGIFKLNNWVGLLIFLGIYISENYR